MARKKQGLQIATVDEYPERPDRDALAPVVERAEVPDQIADYHDTHPTLDTSGPEHDAVLQQEAKQTLIDFSDADPALDLEQEQQQEEKK